MFNVRIDKNPYSLGTYVQNFVQRWSGCYVYWNVKNNRVRFLGVKLPSHTFNLLDQARIKWANLIVKIAAKTYTLKGRGK